MLQEVVNRPDAADLTPADVHPQLELQDCNHLLDDHAALEAFYEKNGYLLLRGVLDLATVAAARDAMLAAAAKLGIVEPGDPTGKWTGVPLPRGMEESEIYSGVAKLIVDAPSNRAVLEKILGEPVRSVPIVQYRTYPPNGPVTVVHQDGFYSPGIDGYKPLWVPLSPCPREVGGLAIAVGQNQRGMLHNIGRPSPYPIPRDAVPDDVWATTDYMPGDVLIVHSCTPHCSLPNTSDRLRVTFDTRLQSAANPTAFAATITAVEPRSFKAMIDDLGEQSFEVDENTYVRVPDLGIRQPLENFMNCVKPGMRLVVVHKNHRAIALRRASEG